MREPLRADEKILLNLLVSDAEARQELIPEMEHPAAVEQFATERIFKALFVLHAGGGTVTYEELHARLEEADRELLASAVLRDETNGSAVTLSLGVECLRSLQRSSLKTQVAALKARVKEAERSGNLREAMRLAEELHDLEKARKRFGRRALAPLRWAFGARVYNVGNSLTTGRGASVAPEDEFDRLQQLVEKGKEKGYVAYEDLAAPCPPTCQRERTR